MGVLFRHWLLMLVALVALVALAGCGDDGIVGDAGGDASVDGGDSALALVTPPDIPWLAEGAPPIMLAPCPEGWREVHERDVTECDPYPEGGALSCEEGEAHFPGEPACRPIGDACPTGDYAATLPSSGPVLYVNAGAPAGGDGTLAAPFGGLGEVPWVSLSSGATVALGKGTYSGTLPLKAGVHVIGACTRETFVTGITAPVPSVVSVTSAGGAAVVQNITIHDAPQNGALVRGGRRLSLQGVLIERVTGVGVITDGAGTEVSLEDVVIRDTQAAVTGPFEVGFGIRAQAAARLDAARLIVADNRSVGVSVVSEGTRVTLTDTVIANTGPTPVNGQRGRGLNVELGARVDATRLLVTGNHDLGVFAAGVGSSVMLVDAVVRDTQSQVIDGAGGKGIGVGTGAELSATRLLLARNHQAGVFVDGAPSRVELTDVIIRDTQPQEGDLTAGVGLAVQGGGRCDAIRLLVSGSAEFGVSIIQEESVVALVDAVVRDTAPTALAAGLGVALKDECHFEARRVLLADSRAVSLYLTGEGATATLADVAIRDTQPNAEDQSSGRGIQVQEGASLDGARVEVVRSFQVGVMAVSGAAVTLRDASIDQVEVSACASTTCPDLHYGYGVGALSAALSLTRFHITDAALCGVMVAPDERSTVPGSLDLVEGIVSGAEIGACVQVDGYDIGRLTNEVEYRDNGTGLDSTTLPVPGAVGVGGL